MTPGNRFRQNYCDLYPGTRRTGKKAKLATKAVAWASLACIALFSSLLLTSIFPVV